METDLKELLEKIIEEHNKPTEKDRINALEKAIADLAIIIGEASDK
jgi:hypothetical protein